MSSILSLLSPRLTSAPPFHTVAYHDSVSDTRHVRASVINSHVEEG